MDTLTLQPSLFDPLPLPQRQIVNVASVKHLSPFRYPGGKTWLVPEVRKWLETKEEKPADFIEIFAGGGIVGLTVAAERLAGHVTLIELDPDVSAVWHTIFSGDAEGLARRIVLGQAVLFVVKAAPGLVGGGGDHALPLPSGNDGRLATVKRH